jgi:hypothetical protein
MPDAGGDAVVGVIIVFAALAALSIPLLSCVWAYGDAEKRGKSGCLVAILVFFLSWPLGLILWLVFRPEPRNYYR